MEARSLLFSLPEICANIDLLLKYESKEAHAVVDWRLYTRG